MARFGGVSYPIAGIGSVRIKKYDSNLLIGLAVLSGLVGLGVILSNGFSIAAIVFLGIAMLCGLAAKGKASKPMLRTASGDQQAYESRKLAELDAIKTAIEKAVMLRG